MPPSARAHRIRAVAVALGLVGPLVVTVPAHAATTAGISASSSVVDFGDPVTLTVTLEGDVGCLGGRAVTLDWRPADSAAFASIGYGVTSADGTLELVQTQPHTGHYRAGIQASQGCPEAVSGEAPVVVRALVEASLALGSGEAGSCVNLVASVQPARAGQIVELQRRRSGVWAQIEQSALDADSRILSSPCFGFDDIGIVRLRVRWVAQDLLNATATSRILAFQITQAPWMEAIGDAIGGHSVSVAIGEEDAFLYRHDDAAPMIPASNTKLLLSMAMLDALGPHLRIRTSAAVTGIGDAGVVGDLWILGRGDPGVSRATLGSLAREIAQAGVTRIRGRVIGSTDYFRRDWSAIGWNEVARDHVNRPTALAFEGNDVADPERRAAQVLTARLEALGVGVAGKARVGVPPSELDTVAFVSSKPLRTLLQRMLRPSDNFAAEVLGKRLGVVFAGVPGTIAKGAAAIEGFADGDGPDFTIHDSSGLSYANRVTAAGMVQLLWVAEDATWLEDLRHALPTGGQGTLRDRLQDIQVRAKTGSLSEVSALTGWVFSAGTDTWIEFSILSSGMSKTAAASIEDEIVHILAEQLG